MKGNILTIKTLSPTFVNFKTKKKKPSWWDADTLLVHSSFQILSDFIEKERPDKVINWNSDQDHKDAWKELNVLYNYWKKDRPKLEKEKEDTLTAWCETHKIKSVPEYDENKKVKWYRMEHEYSDKKKFDLLFKKMNEQDKNFLDLETKMLNRLIAIRHYLWT